MSGRLLVLLAAALAGASLTLGVNSGQPAGARTAVVCNGKERWEIKTLSDPQVGAVKLDPSQIKHISVKTLRTKQKPAGASTEQRISPVETTVYELEAALIKARWVWDPRSGTPTKKKGDRDIHLVIAAPSDHALTMIVEFPDPACVEAQAASGISKACHCTLFAVANSWKFSTLARRFGSSPGPSGPKELGYSAISRSTGCKLLACGYVS